MRRYKQGFERRPTSISVPLKLYDRLWITPQESGRSGESDLRGVGAVNVTVAMEGTCEFLPELKGHIDQFQELLAVNDGLGQVALRHGSLPPVQPTVQGSGHRSLATSFPVRLRERAVSAGA
jgi:hypothetical protein